MTAQDSRTPSDGDRLHHILENSPDILYELDLQAGRYGYISPAASRLLGYPLEELLTKTHGNLQDYMHPDDWAQFASRNDKLETIQPGDEHSFVVEYRLRRRDGQYLWFQDRHTLVPGADGQIRYVVGAARDVTAAKQFADQTRRIQEKLDRAVEKERRHLAADLHDSIGQQLIGIKMLLQKALADIDLPDREQGRKLVGRFGEAIGEVRRICHGLYPPTLERLGLVPALRQLIGRDGSCRPRVSLRYDEELDCRRFEEHVEISLFRICQEALANAVRHGRPDEVRIELARDNGGLVLEVADDGRGFDPAAAPMGLGLLQMRRRAASCGGEMTVYSEPGRSVVRAVVPLESR